MSQMLERLDVSTKLDVVRSDKRMQSVILFLGTNYRRKVGLVFLTHQVPHGLFSGQDTNDP